MLIFPILFFNPKLRSSSFTKTLFETLTTSSENKDLSKNVMIRMFRHYNIDRRQVLRMRIINVVYRVLTATYELVDQIWELHR